MPQSSTQTKMMVSPQKTVVEKEPNRLVNRPFKKALFRMTGTPVHTRVMINCSTRLLSCSEGGVTKTTGATCLRWYSCRQIAGSSAYLVGFDIKIVITT